MLADFRTILSSFATGVTIVTTRNASGEPVGLTVNSFTSVSLTPPLVLFCLAHTSRSHAAFLESEHFAVHIMKLSQLPLVQKFVGRKNKKFEGIAFEWGERDLPLIKDAFACLECERHAVHDGGDHSIIIGRVLRFKASDGKRPLVFFGSRFGSFQPHEENIESHAH